MTLSRQRADELTSAIGRARVLILGDAMLDEYLFGTVDRISPEAPVPVVDISSSKLLLGGAANVAANIRALGDQPLLVSTVGDDEAADKLRALLAEKNISSDFLVTDSTRMTTIKTRIMAHNQQVVRADRETRRDLDGAVEDAVLRMIDGVSDSIAALIVSDYGKGVITLSLLTRVIELCLRKGVFIAVDPKETHFHNYERVSVITPNHHEAGFAYGRRINTEADLLEVGNGLLDKLQAKSILITRGAQGMSLFRRDVPPTHIPTFARKVYDVTGAGDTVIAVFVSAVAAGANEVEAAVLANAAAGYTVGEVGTASISVEQLARELEHNFKNGMLTTAASKQLTAIQKD